MDKKNGAVVAPQSTHVSPEMIDLQGFLNEMQKKSLYMGLYQKEAKKVAADAFTEAEKNCSMSEKLLMND